MATAFYVATLARYVIVEAKDESEAKELGVAALRELYPDVWWLPDAIRTVRPATTDEIDMIRTHDHMLATEVSVHAGDRIRLVSMRDDPDPLEAGELGTVTDEPRSHHRLPRPIGRRPSGSRPRPRQTRHRAHADHRSPPC